MSYVLLRVDTEKDSPETLIAIIEDLFTTKNDNNQTTLTNNKTNKDKERKYFCNNPGCKKEIPKDVVAFCLHEDEYGRTCFDGKVYCRECQAGK